LKPLQITLSESSRLQKIASIAGRKPAKKTQELVPAEPAGRVNPKRQSAEERQIEIPHQRLSEFRKLAIE